MKVQASSKDIETGEVKRTRIDDPQPMFIAQVRTGELMLNMSYGGDTVDDGDGNPVSVHVWIDGSWKIEYKGKEYLMKIDDNVAALIEWINSNEK